MNDVQLIDYQGKRIVYLNFGINPSNNKEYWDNTINYILSQPLNSVLILLDATDLHVNADYRQFMEQSNMKSKPHIKAQAIYGLSNLLKVAFKILNINHKINGGIFDSKQEALDWLVNLK